MRNGSWWLGNESALWLLDVPVQELVLDLCSTYAHPVPSFGYKWAFLDDSGTGEHQCYYIVAN